MPSNLYGRKSSSSLVEDSKMATSQHGAQSQSPRPDGGASQYHPQQGPVTNYRSFAEHPQASVSPASRSSGGDPVSLVASHEVLLQDHRNLNDTRYRGFSTSMHDMYIATEFERVDCCAMACGGIFQSDRDRYLLQGITPPSIARRFWLHIFFPLLIFALAAAGAMRIPDQSMNQIFTTATIVLLLVYLIRQCYKGRSKRIEIRKDLLWTKSALQANRHQNLAVLLEQDPPDDFNQEQEYYLGQSQRDFGCAHPCCLLGCYAEDRAAYELRPFQQPQDDQQTDENQRQVARDARRRQANLSRCLWDYACPAIWCGHQLQLCGICALAQEAREVESAILPAAYRRVDYISMQPISHYYPAIYKKRHGTGSNRGNTRNPTVGGLLQGARGSDRNSGHDTDLGYEESRNNTDETATPFVALSNLSWQLVQFALTVTGLILIWSFGGKYFWKYGLDLAVPEWRVFGWKDFLVYCAVWLQALGLTAIFCFFCNRPRPTNLSLDAMIKFFAAGFCLSTAMAIVWELVLGVTARAFINLAMALSGVGVVVDEDGYSSDWVAVFGADSFARNVAGKTESDSYLRAFGHRHPVFYTFYLAFCSFCLAAFVEEACKYFGYRMVEHPDFMTQREVEEAMTVVIQQGADDGDEEETRRQEFRRRQQLELEQLDFSKQKKSVQSLGGAITLSMICVSMGFTCCENLVYIFVYSGNSIGMELSVLVARSLFPVHPIAAALQSIRVVERDVEVTRTARLGRILTPAVLFHGTYDFFLLWIDFMSERKEGNYVENSNKIDFAGYVSFLVSLLVMAIAVIYYFACAVRQRSRLQVTDQSVESGQSVLI